MMMAQALNQSVNVTALAPWMPSPVEYYAFKMKQYKEAKMKKEVGEQKGHEKSDGELVNEILKEEENLDESQQETNEEGANGKKKAMEKIKQLEAEVKEIQKKLSEQTQKLREAQKEAGVNVTASSNQVVSSV
jgi:seryl-tRNA synthetase